MKNLPYLIAGVAALGIAIAIINLPADETATDESGQPASSIATQDVAYSPMEESGEMTLSVPNMHCQFMCFPKVQKALEESAEVESVALAPQPGDGSFNPQVVVQYKKGFDPGGALSTLDDAGYPNSTVASEDG